MPGLKRLELFNSNRPIRTVKYWNDRGELFLNPPYQRGGVWGPIRSRNLIKSIMQRIPIPSLIINDRFAADWPDGDIRIAVIDGKQRLTTILNFFASELAVPGEWFGDHYPEEIYFEDLEIGEQRRFHNCGLTFSEGKPGDIGGRETGFRAS